ncbi:hypothetical protein AMELA_G00146480 [Ameiurus melas]|uniref:Disks large homologue 1 N-terminal PEST domain-containing protein n=1 Tax=Ameiurus melas TaxID=219545 RepID=A0A7J6AIU2_AMEME|nr:hypothetical protein AMELA_G00146480 [Ameiurus melas]
MQEQWQNSSENRPPAVQGSQQQTHTPACLNPSPNPALMNSPWYHYQDDESPPEHSYPRLTGEVRAPELVHVSERNLSEIENVHGYVSHAHISPLKVSTFTIRNTMRDCCHGLPYVFYSSSLSCCYYLDRSSPENNEVLV